MLVMCFSREKGRHLDGSAWNAFVLSDEGKIQDLLKIMFVLYLVTVWFKQEQVYQ